MHSIRFLSPFAEGRLSTKRYATHADAQAELDAIARLSQTTVRAEIVTVDVQTHAVRRCGPSALGACELPS